MHCPLYIATSNKGKLKEIAELALEYFGSAFANPIGRAAKVADETESSFVGNCQIKALALMNEILKEGLPVFAILADDSGLSVDLLEGRPGVHSARYAGDHASSDANVEKLLQELANHPSGKTLDKRNAHYSCAITLIVHTPTRRFQWNAEGQCQGLIDFKATGQGGFGYDPVFLVPEYQKTFGEIPFEIKNKISHRRRAFDKLKNEAGRFLWIA